MIPSQEVQDGVNAAVDAGQRPGDLVSEVDDVEEPAVQLQNTGGVVERPRDVERDEAHGEHHQHHDDELDGFLMRGVALLAAGQSTPGPAQGPRHQEVAHHYDHERDAEQQHHDNRAVVHILVEGLLAGGVVAQGVVVPPGRGDENEVGHQAHAHHAPHHAAHQVGVARLHQRHGLDGVADAQVAVHADAREEEDAAVEVDVEEEAHYLAGGQPEGPVAAVGVVVDEGGQGEDVQEVGQGEVEHEHCAGVPRTHLPEHPQGGSVEHKADHEHQTVGHGQQDVFKLLVEAAARVEDWD